PEPSKPGSTRGSTMSTVHKSATRATTGTRAHATGISRGRPSAGFRAGLAVCCPSAIRRRVSGGGGADSLGPSMPDLAPFVRALGTAELHLHLEGAVPPRVAGRLARRHGVELPGVGEGDGLDLRQAFPFRDFSGFLRLYLAIARCLHRAEDFAEIVEDLGARLHAQGVGYAEVTFTPSLHHGRGLDDAVMIEGLAAGRRRVRERHDVLVRWVFDVVRIFP